MPQSKKKQKIQYYTISFEKYLDVMKENDQTYNIICERLKDDILNIKIQDWSESEIPDLVESYVLIDSFRIFLDEKINNPTQEEIDFCQKNNIKDILFTKDQIGMMQQYFLNIEERKEYLMKNYSFSCYIN